MSDVPVASSGPALDTSRTPSDQLDTLVRVTTVQGWVYLATLFAVAVTAVAFAVFYRVPTKVNGEGILLIDQDSLAQVRAQATGRLVSLRVKVGDCVAPGDEIGQISQDDLGDAIKEAISKTEDLRRDDRELTQFEDKERESKEAAISKVKQAILRAQDDAFDKLEIAKRVATGADRLRSLKHLGDQDLLEAREKYYDIRDNLNKARSRLAELELEQVSAENTRRRGQLERRLKIRQVETKLALDREKLERTSRVVSHVCGEVAQVLAAPDELVHEGSPIVLLHSPRAENGVDDSGPSYESIVFVPAGEGKKIELGNDVEVMPATVRREEHGFIRGHAVALSELPATKLAMSAALEHPELVDAFLKRYAPGVLLRVHVKLDEAGKPEPQATGRPDHKRRNPFCWSSSSGSEQPLKTGTMCQAAIVVERRRLISLILPWTKTLVGVD
jgi:HlyD family secretion protein